MFMFGHHFSEPGPASGSETEGETASKDGGRRTALKPVHTCLKILQAAFQETCSVCRRELIEPIYNIRMAPILIVLPLL